ncbi:MAG: V-type ATP synthase subunit E family protein [Tissierellia bacterium]|nr:V-type ATP synthase subunit E family protein [Tissierellia bacterium]MDD4779886.1 V-type ATP synthase subunit E family protein [Tissierellia bacterium]
MSIENITEKIISEANNAAESSINNANIKSQEIINEAKKQAENIIAEASIQSEVEAETLKRRKVSAAELQAKKMLLSSKQEAIKKSFAVALEKLNNMPESEYIEFLATEIGKIHGDGEIVLNEKDKIATGEKLIKLISEKDNNRKIVLSNNTIQSGRGFILKNGNIEINSTFEAIIDSIKDELTYEVANVLFK